MLLIDALKKQVTDTKRYFKRFLKETDAIMVVEPDEPWFLAEMALTELEKLAKMKFSQLDVFIMGIEGKDDIRVVISSPKVIGRQGGAKKTVKPIVVDFGSKRSILNKIWPVPAPTPTQPSRSVATPSSSPSTHKAEADVELFKRVEASGRFR